MKRQAPRIGIVVVAFVLAFAATAKAADANYYGARWDPLHFAPASETATDAQCLACHKEVLEASVRKTTPAGVTSEEALAWYQTLNTYEGPQETLHRRHLVTDYAKKVMDLKCVTCHQGNNPREDNVHASADAAQTLEARLRKMVNPETCLMCHGKNNYQVMGLPTPWSESGQLFNNNCLTCHAAIRTARHEVNFLKPKAIEDAGKEDSDVCYGCHGGRVWYRIEYPYPRHPWPGMAKDVPDWAKGRPTESEARFKVGLSKPESTGAAKAPAAEKK